MTLRQADKHWTRLLDAAEARVGPTPSGTYSYKALREALTPAERILLDRAEAKINRSHQRSFRAAERLRVLAQGIPTCRIQDDGTDGDWIPNPRRGTPLLVDYQGRDGYGVGLFVLRLGRIRSGRPRPAKLVPLRPPRPGKKTP